MGKRRGIYKFGFKYNAKWDVPELSDEERRAKVCGDKELRSQRDAETQAKLHRSKGEPMQAYECDYCGYWHIGKKWD